MTNTIETDIKDQALNKLRDGVGLNQDASDLHHYLFNEDYFIIGYYQAEEWLKANPGIFNAIEIIKEYEQDNFGEVTTDLSNSENVVNMYAYIQGEALLSESFTLQNVSGLLDQDDINAIIEELEAS